MNKTQILVMFVIIVIFATLTAKVSATEPITVFLPIIKRSEYRPTHAPTEQPLPTHAPTEVPLPTHAPTETPIVEQCRSVAIMEPGELDKLATFCSETYTLMCVTQDQETCALTKWGDTWAYYCCKTYGTACYGQ